MTQRNTMMLFALLMTVSVSVYASEGEKKGFLSPEKGEEPRRPSVEEDIALVQSGQTGGMRVKSDEYDDDPIAVVRSSLAITLPSGRSLKIIDFTEDVAGLKKAITRAYIVGPEGEREFRISPSLYGRLIQQFTQRR